MAAGFVDLVKGNDEAAALAALELDPSLARARDVAGVSVVCWAVYCRRARVIAALRVCRTDLDLFEASAVGDLDAVRRLVAADAGAVNRDSTDGFSPLGLSAFFGHVEVLRELLRAGAQVGRPSQNAMGVYPINSAAAQSDPEKAVILVAALLDAGADPDARQHGGFTALHEAAHTGNLALIRLLLGRGADRTLATEQGKKPSDLALEENHPEAARALA